MKRVRGSVALLAVIAVAGGCKKQAGDAPGDRGKGVAQVAMPPLFASIPADTPYVMAGIEAVPVEYYARIKNALEPLFKRSAQAWRGENDALLGAILDELDGKWNQAGLESLGFSTEPRYALYGLGLQPVVLRLEVKDHKVLRATIERVAAKAGQPLAPMKTRAGRDYWTIALSEQLSVVVSLADNHLIAAIGTASEIDARLGMILGEERPAQNMADGKLVTELMARHALTPYLVAFADTRRIATAAIETALGAPTPACTAEIASVSAKVPRIVFGYSELSLSKITGGMIVELASPTAAALRAVRTEVPGLAEALSGQPVLAFGGGLDLAKGQQLLAAVVEALGRVGTSCGLEALTSGGAEVSRALARPLPEPLREITGGAIVVHDIVLAQDPGQPPRKLEAVAVLASPDARALFAKVTRMDPALADLGVAPDGKLHDIPAGKLPIPYTAAAAITDKAIVLAVGDQRSVHADKLLRAGPAGGAPLLAMSYDYGKLIGLMTMFQDAGSAADPLLAEFATLASSAFGQFSATIDVTPAGLVMWSSFALK